MRHALLLIVMVAATPQAAESAVDIDSAAQLYQAAEVRAQVRAALPTMPDQVKQLFSRDPSQSLSEAQLAAVKSAAEHGFRIDVFETAALSALAHDLDADSLLRSKQFLTSDLGRRMVADDVATAAIGQAAIEKIMNGDQPVPLSGGRAALIERLERVTRSAESTVQVYLSMGAAVAIGTAIGSGQDPDAVAARAHKSGDAERAAMEKEMHAPMQRFLAYSYRNLSDADLKHLIGFLDSGAGRRYVGAYNAAMQAGYDAMGRRTGEQLGESLRELAQAELDAVPSARNPSEPAPEAPHGAPAAPAAPAPTPP